MTSAVKIPWEIIVPIVSGNDLTWQILDKICQQPNIYLVQKYLIQIKHFVPMVMCWQSWPTNAGMCLSSRLLACDVFSLSTQE